MRENAAEELTGYTLPGGWRVRDKVAPRPGDTGGQFSVSYFVERDGVTAFCKVLNLGWILSAKGIEDPIQMLEEATRYYNFERDIAKRCYGLSKVITAIDSGQTRFEGFRYDNVSYIIFELADHDIRRMLNETEYVDDEVRLALIHDLAVGVRQLHKQSIAHQDVKPSNLLVFQPQAGHTKRTGKIGDLGRVSLMDLSGPFDHLPFAGDHNYAPPEVLYQSPAIDVYQGKLAADLYQLGGMIIFVMTGASVNAYLARELYPEFHWGNWGGTYKEVLPHVQDAMGRVVAHVVGSFTPNLQSRLESTLRQLCEPDPAQRGDRKNHGHSSQYSLERFVTELDYLATRSRLEKK